MFNLYPSPLCACIKSRTVSCAAVSIIVVMTLYQIQITLKEIVLFILLVWVQFQHLCKRTNFLLQLWRQQVHSIIHRSLLRPVYYRQHQQLCIDKLMLVTKHILVKNQFTVNDWLVLLYRRYRRNRWNRRRATINLTQMRPGIHFHNTQHR